MFQVPVHNLNIVTGVFKKDFRIAILQREMRIAAAKVDTPIELPLRVNE
jgi:hypothetical protein